jgi:phage terminase Nu1 subunit (DNA packaging protein)
LGIEVRSGRTYSTRQIFTALAGDLQFERMREARARADLLELEKREREGQLVSIEQCEAMIRDANLPVRQLILALPSTFAARCNPNDPELALEQLEIARNSLLRPWREYAPGTETTSQPADPVLRS